MTSLRPLAVSVAIPLLLALAACKSQDEAPWLTMPTPEQHAARFFPAGSGTPHGQCDCNDCHGATGGFDRFDCLNCHLGSHADQAAVTTNHTGVTGFAWDSAACLRCHRDGTGLGVDHEAIFPIAAGPHSNAQCTECHVQPGDRSVLGCAGCHGHERAVMDDKHQGRQGYVFESRACLGCHPRGQKEGD